MRVMLAENDGVHRAFLRAVIEAMLPAEADVREARDGHEAIEVARDWPPHCVVMDLQMPKISGAEAARAIWRNRPETRILFWSNYSDEAYVRGVAKIVPAQAVYGYVLKSASEERLRFAVQGVFFEDQCVVDREVRGVQRRSEDRLAGLTDGEYDVLIDVALGLTDKAIAARRGMCIRSAQSRLQHIYEKLACDENSICDAMSASFNSRTRAIFLAWSRGLLNAEALAREERNLAEWLRTHDAVCASDQDN